MEEYKSNRRFGKWGSNLDKKSSIVVEDHFKQNKVPTESLIYKRFSFKIFRLYLKLKNIFNNFFSQKNKL